MTSEFQFIRNIKNKYGLNHVGDDCAVLPKDSKTDLIVTADLLVEDIDFRLEWTTPELIGSKALAVSLSDIAAMGGTPEWAMISLGIPNNVWRTKFTDRFYEGWSKVAEHYNVELVGGDVSRSPDKMVIDSIVGGTVRKGRAILRSGSMPGDSIFVTGSLGGANAGLMLLESGVRYSKAGKKQRELIARQLRPVPRVEIGEQLSAKRLATAMIDISDGLGSDLHHICDSSGVGARIERRAIPFDENLQAVIGASSNPLAFAGEDFELLFTSRRKKISMPDLSSITRIGEITSNAGIVELVDGDKVTSFPRSGFRHF